MAEREPGEPPLTLQPLRPEEPVVDGGVLARGATLSEILPPGGLRDSVVSVEYLAHRGDYAGAVTAAARAFNELARAGSAVGGAGAQEGPALYALMLGLAGERYLRFRETTARAAGGRRVLGGRALRHLLSGRRGAAGKVAAGQKAKRAPRPKSQVP